MVLHAESRLQKKPIQMSSLIAAFAFVSMKGKQSHDKKMHDSEEDDPD